MTGRRRERGFTLIEITVVVVILALGVSMVAVYLDGALPQTRLESAARGLASEVLALRSYAITQQRPYWIEYDLDEERYRTVTPFTPEGRLAEDPEERVVYDWKDLPDGVEFEEIAFATGDRPRDGIVSIPFEPLGHSTEHAVYIKRLRPEGFYTLVVNPLTGLPRLAVGRVERPEVLETDFP